MKKETRSRNRCRVTAALLVICMALAPVMAYAGTYGEPLWQTYEDIGEKTKLTQGVYWNTAVSDRVTENYITYTPGGSVVPLIHYGHDIYGAASLKRAVELASQEGYRTVAATNGDFFDTKNGVSLGAVIKNGVIRTSGMTKFNTIGFHQDGSAFIDVFYLIIRADAESLGDGISGLNMNKKMTLSSGAVLYTQDYGKTTEAMIPTVNVVLGECSGEPKVNGKVTAVVESVTQATGAVAIPEGKMVLSMALETPYIGALAQLSAIQVEDTVTFSFNVPNERWNDAVMAIGGETKLVTAGKNVAKSSSKQPRTALGIQADGTIILYTVDGRGSGHSIGATLWQVAERLIELGCMEAINLDGGGSTTIQAVRIGEENLVTVNVPSDGSLPSCGNYILLTNTAEATGKANYLRISPKRLVVLSGAIQTFSAKAADTAGYPVKIDGAIQWETEGGIGSIQENGLFTAGNEQASGAITASWGGCRDSVGVTVIKSPGRIAVTKEGSEKEISSLTLKPGEAVDLKASGYWNHQLINAADYHYSWSAPESLGTIDKNGVFTANEKANGTGTIRVSAGDTSASVALTVKDTSQPFVDMAGHWAESYAGFLYQKGVINGSSSNSGLIFRPNANLTRAEFAVMMSNWLVENVDSYEGTMLPFKDTEQIPSWALNSVKAMYEKGVMQGAGVGTDIGFYPGQSISRQEVMTILGRTQPLDDAAAELNFPDSGDVAEWARPYVRTMVARGVVSGMPDGTLDPRGLVTRAQVLKMIYGLYE